MRGSSCDRRRGRASAACRRATLPAGRPRCSDGRGWAPRSASHPGSQAGMDRCRRCSAAGWVRLASRDPAGPARARARRPCRVGWSLVKRIPGGLLGPARDSRASNSPETQKSWRRPIFPKGCPLSIFGAGELDFRVRDGNGYGLSASATRISCVWMTFGSAPCARSVDRAGRRLIFDLVESVRPILIPALTPGQLLKRSSPRPLVPLSFIRHRTSTCGLSNRWSPCGLTRLTRWGTSSRGELRT